MSAVAQPNAAPRTQAVAAPGPGPVAAEPRVRGRVGAFWDSTVGKKVVMAASGLIMAGFLIAHMAGNLLIFAGQDAIDRYSHFLHETPELLWPARLVLLASVILHIISAVQLKRLSGDARPVTYRRKDAQTATIASRTMFWGGLLLFLFIVLHLLHFTTGTLHPGFMEGDPFGNVVTGFSRQKWVALLYIVMMFVLGMHLYHGAWSAFRTLGVASPSANPLKRTVAATFAVLLALGFTMVPVAVLLGIVGFR